MSGVRARDVEIESGSQEGPGHLGEVSRRRVRRPQVSIVRTADQANLVSYIIHQLRRNPGGFPDTKLTSPEPKDISKAWDWVAPASTKMIEE